MNNATNVIEELLEQAGLHARIEGGSVYLEDPACITRGFEDFLTNAWTVLALVVAGLIMMWGLSMIRGAKNDIKENIKNLVLILGIVTASGPILNMIYGGDLFGIGCKEMELSLDNVQEILATQIHTANTNVSSYENTENENIVRTTGENIYENLQNNPGRAVSASTNSGASNEIVYVGVNGNRWVNVGGNLTWRANNPGALRSTDFTRRMGQIGTTQNGFAIFPDMETGRRAVFALLKTNKYQNRTIAQTMEIYAPWQDGNNPTSYASRVARYIGVSVGTYLRNLSDEQISTMVQAINTVEGTRRGTVRIL